MIKHYYKCILDKGKRKRCKRKDIDIYMYNSLYKADRKYIQGNQKD